MSHTRVEPISNSCYQTLTLLKLIILALPFRKLPYVQCIIFLTLQRIVVGIVPTLLGNLDPVSKVATYAQHKDWVIDNSMRVLKVRRLLPLLLADFIIMRMLHRLKYLL